MASATLTKTGRAALASALKERPLFLAWGSGSETWDTDPATRPSLVNADSLTQEVGRRKITISSFAEPSETGNIIIPIGEKEGEVQESRFQLVDYPTPCLYIQVKFAFSDASNTIIREMGIFSDCQTLETSPEGQQYFLPHEIVNKGMLVAAQHITPPIARSASIRQTCEFVITI